MLRKLILLGSGILWALAMAALVKRELLPYLKLREAPNYRHLLSDLDGCQVMKRDLFFGEGDCVGHAETVMEAFPEGGYRIRSRVRIDTRKMPPRLGIPAHGFIEVNSVQEIGEEFRLDRFQTEMNVFVPFKVDVFIEGERKGKDLHLRHRIFSMEKEKVIPEFEKRGSLSFSDMLPVETGGALYLGKQWSFDMLKPVIDGGGLTWELDDWFAEVIGREVINWNGEKRDVFIVELKDEFDPDLDHKPDSILLVDTDGKVLEQKVDFRGFEIRMLVVSTRGISSEEAAAWRWFSEDEKNHDSSGKRP